MAKLDDEIVSLLKESGVPMTLKEIAAVSFPFWIMATLTTLMFKKSKSR